MGEGRKERGEGEERRGGGEERIGGRDKSVEVERGGRKGKGERGICLLKEFKTIIQSWARNLNLAAE